MGDRDEDCLEGSMKLASLLDGAGVKHEVRIVEGMEHDYPDGLRDDVSALMSR